MTGPRFGLGSKVGSVSAEDVEIVRRWREVLVDEDTEAAAALLAPDVEWVVVGGKSLRGIDEVRKYYAGSGSVGRRTSTSSSIPESLTTSETATSPPSTTRSIAGRKRANSLTSGGHGSNTRSVREGS